MTTTDTPTYAAVAAEHPGAVAAMTRPAWSYAVALAAADEAIAAAAKPKRPARKTARKATS